MAQARTMLDGVMLLWFMLAALALLFVAIDIRSTPESPVLKWGFVLLTAYTGVFGAFLYVLGCREPLPGLHERYTAARWRQTLGSTMHCVAGDGLGILAGAVISSVVGIAGLVEVVVEYVLGFGFGWTIFQALFMRDSAGGSYRAALANTFVPELLSMNLLMAGMVPTVMTLRTVVKSANDPTTPNFWFVMSMGLLVGFVIAYPMNWWLVANHLKHGMMTVRPTAKLAGTADYGAHAGMEGMMEGMAGMAHAGSGMPMGSGRPTRPPIPVMTLLSFLALAGGVALGFLVRPMRVPEGGSAAAEQRCASRRIPPSTVLTTLPIRLTPFQGTRIVMALETCRTGGIPSKAVGGRTCPTRIIRKPRQRHGAASVRWCAAAAGTCAQSASNCANARFGTNPKLARAWWSMRRKRSRYFPHLHDAGFQLPPALPRNVAREHADRR